MPYTNWGKLLIISFTMDFVTLNRPRYDRLKFLCVIEYARLAARKLQAACWSKCPEGCNYIDPKTNDFIYEPDINQPNFSGYIAMVKLGINVFNDDIVSEWYDELMKLPECEELASFITKDDVKCPAFRNEVIWVLLELDHE